jgi:hypothetical protein
LQLNSNITFHCRFVDKTKEFHKELKKLLSILGFSTDSNNLNIKEEEYGDLERSPSDSPPVISVIPPPSTSKDGSSSPPPSPTNSPTSSSIYEHFRHTEPAMSTNLNINALKSLSFAKKMVRSTYDPSYSRAFVPLRDQMDSTLYKIFSKRELRECTEQKPVHVYLYLSAGGDHVLQPSPSTSSIHTLRFNFGSSSNIRKDQAIAITKDMVNYLTSQLALHSNAKDSQDDSEEAKKILLELQHAVAAPVRDIMPPAIQTVEEEEDVCCVVYLLRSNFSH